MEIIALKEFAKYLKWLVKKNPSLIGKTETLQESLVENPFQGVALAHDCFKIRLAIASKDRGNSGGARVITCVKVIQETVYLLTIYDKSEQEDIAENALIQLLDGYELL
ncbi:MAG: hypothetical protein EAZ95_04040 [Bacteroidetes bacterium]|nr:MAG: hypothetical protein EAZ95_04040 [Bacteroidota bacterium]